ncbi:peroxisomal membrane protein PEX14-like isoform X1 [Rhopalosiphum padi]|uniref:peroxisomal membrane protein PEX14-like isoform X1 n=2 Tax=Rhopalosiphum padi TaxID=40932 RepID=UPI00298DB5F0|nr:peroxisomal membrane protein PEX14-like isoform X1 [Rhopalosiphum padi]
MSRNDDKVNSDDNSVAVNAVSNSGNDSTMNKPNTKTANTAKSTFNNWANNSKMNESCEIRKNMVSKATEFLIDETVQKMPVDKKVNFLRKKGLTDYEIQTSIQRAAVIYNDNQNKQNLPPVHYNSSNASGVIQTSFESQSWYSRLFGPIAFAAAVVYVGYKLYKKYIESWLFGAQKSPLEKRFEALELSMQRCIIMLEEKNNSYKLSNECFEQQNEYNNKVRAELKSIKSLLLNRFQFPPAPASSSIPEWQLLKNTKPKVEEKNKTNSSDLLNSLQTSEKNILNETQNSLVVGAQSNGLPIGSDNNKDCMTINSMSNDTSLPTSPNPSRDVDNKNDSKHIENNEGIHH